MNREERLSFGEELLLALKGNVMQEKERYFAEYQGFAVMLPKYMEIDKPYVRLKRKGGNQYQVNIIQTSCWVFARDWIICLNICRSV